MSSSAKDTGANETVKIKNKVKKKTGKSPKAERPPENINPRLYENKLPSISLQKKPSITKNKQTQPVNGETKKQVYVLYTKANLFACNGNFRVTLFVIPLSGIGFLREIGMFYGKRSSDQITAATLWSNPDIRKFPFAGREDFFSGGGRPLRRRFCLAEFFVEILPE